jgi:hypothetical protein
MSEETSPRKVSRIGPLQIVITVLAVITGLIHLNLGMSMGSMMGHPRGSLPAGAPGGHMAGGHMPPLGGGFSIMSMLPLPLPVLFYLNFIGYIVLAIALYLPALLQFQPLLRYQRIIRWLLIIYTAVTIVLWFLITRGHYTLLAYVDKPIEVALIILLLIDDWQAIRQAHLQRG